MHFLYVDESGVEELNAGTSHFVLLGLAIRADQWRPIDQALDTIKGKFGLRGVEIHTAWMARRYSEQEGVQGFAQLGPGDRRTRVDAEIRRRAGVIGVQGNKQRVKAYRRESVAIRPYVHLTRDERRECLRQLASELAKRADICIFADAISKSDFTPGKYTPYELAFEQVLTRYQTFLERCSSTGIVVHDNNTKVAPRIHDLSRKFHQDGTIYKRITRVVETPLFVDSAFTSMIQMSDLCSYALRRMIENNESDLWDLVEPRVCRDQQQQQLHVGVRHYTGKRACNCRICANHRR